MSAIEFPRLFDVDQLSAAQRADDQLLQALKSTDKPFGLVKLFYGGEHKVALYCDISGQIPRPYLPGVL